MTTQERPNVVLVVMDTARAPDAFDEAVTPNLHRIASEGVSYTNAFTTGPWTLPSHASLFTGQYTTDHDTHAGSQAFDPDVPPLAELLQDAGYHTAAFSNNTWVSPAFGFDAGFDDVFLGWELLAGGADVSEIATEYDGVVERSTAVLRRLLDGDAHRTVVNALYSKFLRKRYDDGALLTNWRIKRWLRRRDDDRPFFAFVNYLEPHLEYRPPGEYTDAFLPSDVDEAEAQAVEQDAWSYVTGQTELDDRDFRALHGLSRGEIASLDARIGRLYDHLQSEGLLENTVFVVVGDHGENVGEHGLMDHQYCLYDTLLHVPLVVRYPKSMRDGERPGRRIGGRTGAVDSGAGDASAVEADAIGPDAISLDDLDDRIAFDAYVNGDVARPSGAGGVESLAEVSASLDDSQSDDGQSDDGQSVDDQPDEAPPSIHDRLRATTAFDEVERTAWNLPEPGTRDDSLVEVRDLYPLVLQLAGVAVPTAGSVSRHSPLAPESRDCIVAEYVTPQPSMETLEDRVGTLPEDVRRLDRGLRCLRTPGWKYVEGTDGTERLYDLTRDPGETEDVSTERSAIRADLADALRRRRGELWTVEPRQTADVDEATQQRLEDMGYIQ